MGETRHSYVLALGSNMRVPGVGAPRKVVQAAIAALGEKGVEVLSLSQIRGSRPLGPSQRFYANAAALVETRQAPEELLAILQELEQDFGRKRRGARWRSRPLDLDIVLWSGGAWLSPGLVIPHTRFRERDFVTRPAAEVAPSWRDPVSGLSLRQIARRQLLGQAKSRRNHA